MNWNTKSINYDAVSAIVADLSEADKFVKDSGGDTTDLRKARPMNVRYIVLNLLWEGHEPVEFSSPHRDILLDSFGNWLYYSNYATICVISKDKDASHPIPFLKWFYEEEKVLTDNPNSVIRRDVEISTEEVQPDGSVLSIPSKGVIELSYREVL